MLKRIYFLIIWILVVAILATGLISFQVISAYNDRANRDYLLAAARMIQQDILDGRSAAEAGARVLTVYNQIEVEIRITIVDRQGNVRYDNTANEAEMENHLFRPEISYAFAHQAVGSAIRKSTTLNEQMLYVALYDSHQDLVIRTAMSLQAYRASVSRILWMVGLVLAIAMILLALLGSFSARRITRPLIDLKKAALDMSAGQYAVRIHQIRENDSEVAALSNAFNIMAEQLQNVVRELGDKNARLDAILNTMIDPLLVVSADTAVLYCNKPAQEAFGRGFDPSRAIFPLILLTHCNEADLLVGRALAASQPVISELTLQTTRGDILYQIIASPIRSAGTAGVILTFHDISEARKLQKMRSDFVANVTHELRTPLTSIRGFIETLRNGAIREPEVANRFLDIIDIEAERLHKLISDILALSEIEDLKKDQNQENFDLRALIDDVIVLLDDTASARKISVIAENAESPLPVVANPHRIKQILINLAENAIKYNFEGGKVYIDAARQSDGKVLLSVRDTGPGIPVEQQERIFERFYRIDTSRSRELGGTGLGLSIVKHIAQLYGGAASVISRPGEGSTFQVTLAI